jgi:hypothetical protein
MRSGQKATALDPDAAASGQCLADRLIAAVIACCFFSFYPDSANIRLGKIRGAEMHKSGRTTTAPALHFFRPCPATPGREKFLSPNRIPQSIC